jgi:5-formyltetrahydrofolate cyclo-ligase
MTRHTDIADQKAAARIAAAEVRKVAHSSLRQRAALSLASTGLEFAGVSIDHIVSGFIPFSTEIDTRPLLAKLAASGNKTCAPVVIHNNEPLEFRVWVPGDETVPGRWKIPVPPETAEVVDPDVLLVPLLSFDRAGYRLGYGGGFYDRTLEKLRNVKPVIAVGVGYSAQEVETVIRGEHDQPLDWILTETGPIRPEGFS